MSENQQSNAENDAHGDTCDGCVVLRFVDRAETAEGRLAEVWDALDRANALHPDQFKTGQGHLSPAFREVNFRAAFEALVGIVNQIENASGYATRPIPPEGSDR